MRHEPMLARREDGSTLAILALVVSTCAIAAGAPRALAVLAAASILALLLLNWRHIPRRLAQMAIGMAAVGAMLLPFTADPPGAIAAGLNIGGIFLSLMTSVSMLVAVARRSDLFKRIAAALFDPDLPAPTLWMTGCAHLFPALLNIGGAVLLCEMASTRRADENGSTELPVLAVIHRGFLSACCWSPIFGNLALILLAYPELAWPDVAPLGLGFGILASLVSMAVGPAMLRSASPRPEVAAELARGLAPLVGLMLVFLASSLVLHALTGLPTAIVIVAQTPLYALLCHRILSGSGRAAVRGFVGDVRRLVPGYAPEAIFFASGGSMMMILSGAIPPGALDMVAAFAAGSAIRSILILMGLSVAFAAVGVHPFLTALFLANTLSPATLGLAPLPHFMTILYACAISFGGSPYTLLSLVVARYSQRSPYTLVYGWNGPFLAAAFAAGALVLWIIARVGSA